MKYFFIIGERSGDLHASNLIRAIRQKDPEAIIEGVGGELSQSAGMKLTYHYKDMSVMGIVQVILHLRMIKQNFRRCENALFDFNPDAVVLVDFPGFNLRMAKYAKERGFKVFYYIAPKVWASRSKRVAKIKAYTDKVFTIFPFENDFFSKHKVDFQYVGNPLLDALERRNNKDESKSDFIERYHLKKKPIIALLAGSRRQEVKKMLPKYLAVSDEFPDYQVVLAGVDNLGHDFYQKIVGKSSLPPIIYNDTYTLLQNSEAALVTSGTATLETALLKIPQAACYDLGGGKFIYTLYDTFMLKVKYVTLVNLILNKFVIKEFLQHHLSVENLKRELHLILEDKVYRENMILNYEIIIKKLGGIGASDKTAEAIYTLITQ